MSKRLSEKQRNVLTIGVLMAFILFELLLFWFYFSKPLKKVSGPPHFISKFSKVSDKKSLSRPLGIAVSERKIYVADANHGKIQVFDLEGKFLYGFTTTLKNKDKSYPIGVAADEEGHIYVSELLSRKILVFSPQGSYLYNFPQTKQNILKKPVALAYSAGKIYVTDVGDHKVKIFTTDGKLLKRIGRVGQEEGRFYYPNGIAISPSGDIYVSDSNNHRIQVFDKMGKFKKSFGENYLALPRGISIDSKERVHVADTFRHEVVVFDKNGKLLFTYLKAEETKETPRFPHAIAINENTWQIYVTDRLNNNVTIWGY